MDQLSKDACAAIKAGMTYGKYIARKELLAATYSAPESVKTCLFCGCPLPRGKGNRRYCNGDCAEKYRQEKQK